MTLVDYGIQNESSDIRAHVCPGNKCVYVYPTCKGVELALSKQFPLKPAGQDGVEGPTAEGYCVPIKAFGDKLKTIDIPDSIWRTVDFKDNDNSTQKGDKAVRVVSWLLKAGRFPLQCLPDVIEDVDLQYKGTDIKVDLNARIQVKCDMSAAKTGNLFLQVAERNPLGMH